MTILEALREVQKQAIISGGISQVNGKNLTGNNGFWYLDGERVTDLDREVYDHVVVDDNAVLALLGRNIVCSVCGDAVCNG